MNLPTAVIVAYLVAFLVNILLLRYNVGGLGGWLAMLADSRHGRLLNIVALIVVFFPPIVYLILLLQLYGYIQKQLRKNPVR